jgi:hypothetical protein
VNGRSNKGGASLEGVVRGAGRASTFPLDLVLSCPQITSDGFEPYSVAMEEAFEIDVDYSQLVKVYQAEPARGAARRYSPGYVVGVERTRVIGRPRAEYISTSYVERSNLTLRMQQRRFTRLTNGFSKKLDSHRAAVRPLQPMPSA